MSLHRSGSGGAPAAPATGDPLTAHAAKDPLEIAQNTAFGEAKLQAAFADLHAAKEATRRQQAKMVLGGALQLQAGKRTVGDMSIEESFGKFSEFDPKRAAATPTKIGDEQVDLTTYRADQGTLDSFQQKLDARSGAGRTALADAKIDSIRNPVAKAGEHRSQLAKRKAEGTAYLGDAKPEEARAVFGYTQERRYEGGKDVSMSDPTVRPDFDRMNPTLYMPGMEGEREAWGDQIKATASGLNAMQPTTGTTFRSAALPQQIQSRYKPGETVSESAFFSTSKNKDIDQKFVGNTKYEVVGKSGRSLEEMTETGGENEVLFAPGTNFDVERVVRRVVPKRNDGSEPGKKKNSIPQIPNHERRDAVPDDIDQVDVRLREVAMRDEELPAPAPKKKSWWKR